MSFSRGERTEWKGRKSIVFEIESISWRLDIESKKSSGGKGGRADPVGMSGEESSKRTWDNSSKLGERKAQN